MKPSGVPVALSLLPYRCFDPNSDFKRRDKDGFSLKVEVFMFELRLINHFKVKTANTILNTKSIFNPYDMYTCNKLMNE